MADLDTMAEMSDYEFQRLYRAAYHHSPALKARLDQEALGAGYPPRRDSPRGEAAKIAQERERRNLVYPQSWIDAGLILPGE